MNTNQNKAALWSSCVEQGVFNKIPSDMMPQTQNLFETTIAKFNHAGVDVPVANQAFLVDFKRELSKMSGVNIKSTSFEDTEKEYLSLLKAPTPKAVDFNEMKDEPLGDIERIIQEKQQQRQMEMDKIFQKNETQNRVESFNEPDREVREVHEPFKSFQPFKAVNEVKEVKEVRPDKSSTEIMHILKSQNNVLTKILESQLKILELLQKL